jgi:hypothetical protein
MAMAGNTGQHYSPRFLDVPHQGDLPGNLPNVAIVKTPPDEKVILVGVAIATLTALKDLRQCNKAIIAGCEQRTAVLEEQIKEAKDVSSGFDKVANGYGETREKYREIGRRHDEVARRYDEVGRRHDEVASQQRDISRRYDRLEKRSDVILENIKLAREKIEKSRAEIRKLSARRAALKARQKALTLDQPKPTPMPKASCPTKSETTPKISSSSLLFRIFLAVFNWLKKILTPSLLKKKTVSLGKLEMPRLVKT